MQIPTNFSAAQAASIASSVSSRDKSAVATNTAASNAAQLVAQLEKSDASNPDRDAQGQGDGLGEHARRDKDENEVASEDGSALQTAAPNNAVADSAGLAPTDPSDDPPAQLLNLIC